MKSIIRSIGKSMGKKASKQALPPEDAKLSVKGKENGFEPTKNGSYPASISSVSSAVNGSTSSYRHSTEQDSAINELLEGRMKLTVNIVHRNEQVVISVERRTPLLDLLVSIGTQFHFNPSNYVIQVDEDGSAPNASSREYKASTPIGILDASKVSVVSKPEKVPNKISFNRQQSAPSELPFKPTIRLQVNLPHNQMMVLRLMPSTELTEIKDMICKEKSIEAGKYLLVKPFKPGQSPMVLELDKSLEFYHINEVTILANKTYQELSKQFSSSNRNQFSASMYDEGSNRLGDQNDLSQSTPNIAKMNGMYKRSVAESNSDLTSIHRSESSSRTGRLYKNKPAPPPPLKGAKSVQNLAPIRDEDERPASEIYTSYEHNDSSSLSEHSTTTEGSKPADVITVQPKRGLSRHNSGSDSSGYHEMLSHTEADTPTDSNSPAPPLSLSPHPSESFSDCSKTPTPLVTKPPVPCQRTSLNKTTKAPAPPTPGSLSSTNSGAKKRRAPLPPSSGGESNKLDSNADSKRVSVEIELSEPMDTSAHNVESPILVESEPNSVAMSTEVASTSEASSSSSAFVEEPNHSLNNQSLSPIVIIKTSQSESINSSSLLDGSDTKTPMNSTMIPSISEESFAQPQPLSISEEASESHEQLPHIVSVESSTETIAPETPAAPTPPSSPSLSPPPSPQSSPPISAEPVEIFAEVEKNLSPSINNVSSGDLSATEQYTNNGQVETVVEAGDVANGGDVNQHYGSTTAIQPKTRLSTLGHDRKLSHSQSVSEKQSVPLVALERKTSSTLNSYRKALEQASPDLNSDHHHHFHQHSEDEICACEQFASNYNRIRSQFSHFEDQHNKSPLPCSSSTLAKLNSEKCAENIEESTTVEKVQEETIYPTSSIEQTSADSNDLLSIPQPVEVVSGDLGVNSDSSLVQESAPEAGDLEMNSSLKRPSVVTISEWKTPKDTDILLVNSQSSSNGFNGPTKSHSSLDRNLEKQVEVTLNEFNETLDRLDDSLSPSPLPVRKEIPNSTFVPHITVENSQNGHSKINITSNNVINGQSSPKSISANSDQGRAKVVVGSMKDSSPSTNSTSNPNVSTTPTKSVRDNILKFSAASSLSNRTSVSHQDLPSLRSLPATPSGTLRRSSSKVATASTNGPIPEVESPQVTRKLTNFRIGSFKKELDIFEHPQANSTKPTIVTAAFKQSTAKPTTNAVSSINDAANVSTTNINVTKPTPTVISVNGATATQSNGTNALPKESAKKVFNASNASTPTVVTNGGSGRTFLQELKSRTWSYRTGLSQFSEQDEHNEESHQKADISKSNVNNVKRFNVAQGNIFPSKTNISTNGNQSDYTNKVPLANGHHKALPSPIETNQLISNSSVNINQSESKPAVVASPNIPLPPPPPPPPPMAPIDSSLVNRPLSPEFAQTNTLLAPTGWKSVKATEPKQIRSPLRSQSVTTTTSNGPKSPVSSADPHDALLNEIRNFQNKSKLKKVTNNEPFSLAVHGGARM